MRMHIAYFLGVVLLCFGCMCDSTHGADDTEPNLVLHVRAPKDTPYGKVAVVVDSVRRLVSERFQLNLEVGTESGQIELTLKVSSKGMPSLVSKVIQAARKLDVGRIKIAFVVGGQSRSYTLFNTYESVDSLQKKNSPFILWFHAEWNGESVALQQNVFCDPEIIRAVAMQDIPVVRVDHTNPTEITNRTLEVYSPQRFVPLVAFVSPKKYSEPSVVIGRFTKNRFIALLSGIVPKE